MLNRRLAKRQARQRAVIGAIAAIAVLLGVFFEVSEALDTTLQTAVYDRAIALSPAHVRNQITIVALDDPTVRAYNVYPLPRRAYAEMLRALKPLNPTVIAFDVSFYDPSPSPADDAALAAAIKDAGNVILAMQGKATTAIGDHRTKFAAIDLPIKELRDAAAGLGAVDINPDPDHVVRDSQMIIEGPDGTRYFGLPLVAAAKQLRADLTQARIENDRLIVPAPLGDRAMPITRGGGMAIYYAAQPATPTYVQTTPCSAPDEFCVVSLKDVVAGTVPKNLITGRTIFVGAHSISAVPDDYPVPHAQGLKMFGVEIWANTAQSIFTNRYPVLKQGFFTTLLQLLIVTVLGGMLLILRWRLVGLRGSAGTLSWHTSSAPHTCSSACRRAAMWATVRSRSPRSATSYRRRSGGSSHSATSWSRSGAR